jgi:aspartyl-tRNA(Asn)/glutamyl-tRNA(Gln) amidotransferase subunit B
MTIHIRFDNEYGLSSYDAQIIASSKSMADFYESAVASVKNYSLLANWLIGEISAYLNKELIEIDASKLNPKNIAMLINRIDDQTISGKIGKSIFEEMCINGSSPDQIIESKGLKQITDDDSIEKVVDEVIENNPEQVDGYKSGKEKLFGFFVGQVMKKTQGKANPQTQNSILKDKLK